MWSVRSPAANTPGIEVRVLPGVVAAHRDGDLLGVLATVSYALYQNPPVESLV